jgi:hypothetical protein
MQDNYDNLRNLGVPEKKISTYVGLLLRDPNVLNLNFRYLESVGINPAKIKNHPQMLASHPDALVKAMRILKLDILGLRIFDDIEINKYQKFYTRSPATLFAKIHYLAENGFNYAKNVWLLVLPWQQMINATLHTQFSKMKANVISQKYTKPLKKKYDEWMKEYKLWSDRFAKRRGRRLIRKI